MAFAELENTENCSNLIIIGAGGHATSIANVATAAGFKIAGFVDPHKSGQLHINIPVLRDMNELDDIRKYDYAIAVGDNSNRERLRRELVERYDHLKFPPIIHSSAIVSDHATIGDGTVVMPNAVVGPNTNVGEFCILNTMSSIDHDCVICDFASLAPGVVTGGNVRIGMRSAVSIGAVIKHGIKIGEDSVVGANSFVNKEISSNVVVYGNPAKVIRKRKIGDPYLG